jgi:hypothetical protein
VIEFEPFPKIARLNRQVTVAEKIDGTNGQVHVRAESDDEFYFEHGVDTLTEHEGLRYVVRAGSRNRWLPTGGKNDNYGFGLWVSQNADELVKLGVGRHFGEWWGCGIGRNYGLHERRFSLFNTHMWRDGRKDRPACCLCVPVLAEGTGVDTNAVLEELRKNGSFAQPGFMDPEGIAVWHSATRVFTKATCKNDEQPKGQVAA